VRRMKGVRYGVALRSSGVQRFVQGIFAIGCSAAPREAPSHGSPGAVEVARPLRRVELVDQTIKGNGIIGKLKRRTEVRSPSAACTRPALAAQAYRSSGTSPRVPRPRPRGAAAPLAETYVIAAPRPYPFRTDPAANPAADEKPLQTDDGRCRARTCDLLLVRQALWPAELTARGGRE
jgi:hypothetical protein